MHAEDFFSFFGHFLLIGSTIYSHFYWTDSELTKMIHLIDYDIWIFLFTYHLHWVLSGYTSSVLERPNHERNRARFIRRHRRRKPPFYSRSKTIKPDPSAATTQRDEWESPNLFEQLPYWQTLHHLGNMFGNEFDALCTINPDIMRVLKPDTSINLLRTSYSDLTESFSFSLGSDKLIGLTEMTDTNRLFRFQASYQPRSQGPKLIFDSGASISITPVKKDFVHFDPHVGDTKLTGVTTEAICQGRGRAKFSVLTDDGEEKSIEVDALYVPDAHVRLLSVQRFCLNQRDGSEFKVNEHGSIFTFPRSMGVVLLLLTSNPTLCCLRLRC